MSRIDAHKQLHLNYWRLSSAIWNNYYFIFSNQYSVMAETEPTSARYKQFISSLYLLQHVCLPLKMIYYLKLFEIKQEQFFLNLIHCLKEMHNEKNYVPGPINYSFY